MELRELLEQYKDERQPRPPTLRQHELVLRLLARDVGVRLVEEVSRESLDRWRTAVLSRARSSTWNNYYRHFRALWRFGAERGLTKLDVLIRHRERFANLAIERVVPKTTTAGAIKDLRKGVVRLKPEWFWIMVLRALALTGMRRRQLVSVRWRDVDLVAGALRLSSDGSKTGNEWTIALHPDVIADLLDLRGRLATAGKRAQPSDQVWNVTSWNPRYKGAEMTPTHVSGFFRRLQARLGKKITAHGLRHALATELVKHEKGGLATAQQMLGHTDIRVTMGYVAADLEHMRALLGTINLD